MNVGLVIGNGGSLAEMPLEFLKRYPSIGSNHIFLLEGFTPTYYTAIDPIGLMADFEARLAAMPCIKILGRRVFNRFSPKNVLRIETGKDGFSKNLFQTKACEGWSVTYVNLQLAYYLGWETVLLVGVDHWSRGRGDHFTNAYYDRKLTTNVTLPNMTYEVERYYTKAKAVFEQAGRQIINVTPGTALNVFPKEDWQKWNI